MADNDWLNRHRPSEKMKGIRRAAVSFANDYGPLPAANRGDEDATHAVAMRLVEALKRQGLTIVRDPAS